MRIVAAMSGGVDSSVAAALLADEGHDVVGLSMQLYDQREGGQQFGSCCTLDDLHDARRVAARLGIPHYIVNFERQFDEQVVSHFVGEYTAARTPDPVRPLQQRPEVHRPAAAGRTAWAPPRSQPDTTRRWSGRRTARIDSGAAWTTPRTSRTSCSA